MPQYPVFFLIEYVPVSQNEDQGLIWVSETRI